MNQRQIYILVGLVLVLGGVLWHQMRPTQDYPQPQPSAGEEQQATANQSAAQQRPAAAPSVQTAQVNLDELLESVQEVEFDYDAERTSRNPMTPLAGPRFLAVGGAESPGAQPEPTQLEAALRAMRVSGILFDAANPLAVVNDEVVGEGAELSQGVRVSAIESDHVVLTMGETSIPIYIEEY